MCRQNIKPQLDSEFHTVSLLSGLDSIVLTSKHSSWATVGGMNKHWPSAILARFVLLIRGGANPRTNTVQHSLEFPLCHVARQSAKGGNVPLHDAEAISQTFPT